MGKRTRIARTPARLRTRLESTIPGVRLTYQDEPFGLVIRDFYTSKNDQTGYVWENGRQVCEGLYSTGRALESHGDLLATIRREWRRNRAAERKAVRRG